MSDPIEQLIEEHLNILRGVKLLEVTGKIAVDKSLPTDEVEDLIEFFRKYADDGHHTKEENILFTRLYEKDEGLKKESSPLAVLTEQHVTGRKLVSNISRMDNDFPFHVEDYGALLRRHIDIEDEVFPVLAADHFSDAEIALIMTDFERENGLRDLNAALKLLDKVEMQIL
ncbi:MAG: hemerythrin domain-containing protein [Candidatus Heimdallarchaeota archaeon]